LVPMMESTRIRCRSSRKLRCGAQSQEREAKEQPVNMQYNSGDPNSRGKATIEQVFGK